MSKHGIRQQKQLAKKKAKRADKRSLVARQNSADPTLALAGASTWPVISTLVPEDLWEQGIGQVAIARRALDGRLVCGVYLVDVYCLGVKSAFWRIMTSSEYRNLVGEFEKRAPMARVSPEHLAKLVLGAVDYAQALGLAPHPDYRHARMLMEGIDPALCPTQFQFGKNGKPLYIRGPHESLEKARAIGNRVKEAGGDYIVLLDEAQPRSLRLENPDGEILPLADQLGERD